MARRKPGTNTQEEIDFQTVTSMDGGRRILWELLEGCGIFKVSYNPGSFDATAYNEGVRSVGLRLLEKLETHCPGSLALMRKEAKHALELATAKQRPEDGGSWDGDNGGDGGEHDASD